MIDMIGNARFCFRRKWIFAICTFVFCIVLYHANTKQPIVPSGSGDLAEKTKDELHHSEWIKLFPNLEHMVSQIDDIHSKQMTSAEKTFISISSSSNNFEVGKILTAYILSADEIGQSKKYGGDFFFVSLRRSSSDINGVSCEVFDEMNGYYRVTCILPWPGEAILSAVLIHPSESIYQMMRMYSSEREYGLLQNCTIRNSIGKEEHVLCTVGFPEKGPDELCDYSNTTHGEPWKCIKPKSGECAKITWINNKVVDYKLLAFWDNVYFRKNVNFNVSIGGSGTAIFVKDTARHNVYQNSGGISQISLNPAAPSGWFYESKWMSNQVVTTGFSVSKLKRCVKNTDFYFIGDSTIRQWYGLFIEFLRVKDYGPENKIAWSHRRDGRHKKLNASLHYRAHGLPLHNPGPPDSRPYISDTLDSIKNGGKGTMVVITLGYHFELFDADVFWDRLKIVKSSIKALLKRFPGTSIYIKGLHTHGYISFCPSPWLTYRFETMMRHALGDIKGVVYLPLWDLTSVAGNVLLHPKKSLLTKEIGLFLSYIC